MKSKNLISVEEQKQNEITFYSSNPKGTKGTKITKKLFNETWNKKSEKKIVFAL